MAVAVGAEHAKVLEAVVACDAVDVIDVAAERFASPLRDAALLAAIL